MSQSKDEYQYLPKITRRQSLKWLGALAASTALPGLTTYANDKPTPVADTNGHWPEVKLPPITAKGYGKDPNMIMPPTSPWPRTLTPQQLTLVAVLCDYIVPKDGNQPSASSVGVPDVVDEWVSSPYENQHRDRLTILSALAWLDDEAEIRGGTSFINLPKTTQIAILDDIAYWGTAPQFSKISHAFSRFRSLVLAAYFCTPQGTEEIGYMGNVPIAGDYPGPTPEALAHLKTVLDELGLSQYQFTG